MNLTDLSTRQWPSVAVAVALVGLFGLTSISSLPIQLLPNTEEPQISVANFWRAAASEEMDENIVEPQVTAGGGPQTRGAASLLVRVLPDSPNRELSRY